MLARVLGVVILVGIGYWFWTGPYRERTQPTYGQTLEQNDKAMEDCVRRKTSAASLSVTYAGNAEEVCARELGLYFEDGHWYDYEDRRD